MVGGLTRDAVSTCVSVLKRVQDGAELDDQEKVAVSSIYSWLETAAAGDLDNQLCENTTGGCSESSGDQGAEHSRASTTTHSVQQKRTRHYSDIDPTSKKVLKVEQVSITKQNSAVSTFTGTDMPALSQEGNGSHTDELAQLLEKVDSWDEFDIFRVRELTDDKPLQVIGYAVLSGIGALEKLNIPPSKLKNFLKAVEEVYVGNPYHNSMHAADVVQSMHAMLMHDRLQEQLTPMELFALVLAAIVHDAAHPGVTNDFLIRTRAEVAIVYNDRSPNENKHLSTAFHILSNPDNNILAHFSDEDYRFIRRTMIDIVLATDMAGHHKLFEDFTTALKLYGDDVSTWPKDMRPLLFKMVMHCADIANPAKPLSLSMRWTDRIMQESWNQGDKERIHGLPVTPACDRETVHVASTQLRFVEYFAKPCYEALARIVPNTCSLGMRYIDQNRLFWERSRDMPVGALQLATGGIDIAGLP